MAAPINISVDNVKPIMLGVDFTSAQFSNETALYSDPNVLYSDTNHTWGGSDTIQGGKPINIAVDKT
jgi:hypothetical protein